MFHILCTTSIDSARGYGACRMVNDEKGRGANTVMKVITVQGTPNLGLFAKRSIRSGEELRYDYGDDSAPWRKKVRYSPQCD